MGKRDIEFGWAHIRTHPKPAIMFEKNNVLLFKRRPCRVKSAKTIRVDRNGALRRSLHIIDVLSGQRFKLTEDAGNVLKECRVLKEEFEVLDEAGRRRTVCAMPVVELRERPQPTHPHTDFVCAPATSKVDRSSPAGRENNGVAKFEPRVMKEFPRVEYSSGDAGKQRIVYKASLWCPFEVTA